MARPSAEICDRLDTLIRANLAITTAADEHSIDLAVEIEASGHLDEQTVAFLKKARGLALAALSALSAVLDAHRAQPVHTGEIICRECGTVDRPCRTLIRIADSLALYGLRRTACATRNEAWELADAHFNHGRNDSNRLLIFLQDFGPGYLARGVRVELPPPPLIPTLDTETIVVIDKANGQVSIWPLLPTQVLATQYDRYRRTGESMDLAHPDP